MNELLIVLCVTANDAPICDHMLTWMKNLNGGNQRGHILIAFDFDTSDEMRDRLKICAELGFLSVSELIVPRPEKPQSENARRNNLFLATALRVQSSSRVQWILLEGGCVTTNPDWYKNICAEYFSQPFKYLGLHLKNDINSPDKFMGRIGVYPVNAHYDMASTVSANLEIPFEHAMGMNTVVRSSKSRSFQMLKIIDESDFSKVWPEAQIVTGDISGAFIEKLRAQGVHLPKAPTFKECYDAQTASAQIQPKHTTTVKDGIIRSEFENGLVTEMHESQRFGKPILHIREEPKPDLRTKAGREWKAARANGTGH